MSDIASTLLIACIVVYVWLSMLVAEIGDRRGFSYWGMMCAALAFTPLGGFAIVILLSRGEKPAERNYKDRKPPYLNDG